MTESTIRTLAWAEHDFLEVDTSLEALQKTMADCAHELAACRTAARRLGRMRKELRALLALVDADLTLAIRKAEQMSPPF